MQYILQSASLATTRASSRLYSGRLSRTYPAAISAATSKVTAVPTTLAALERLPRARTQEYKVHSTRLGFLTAPVEKSINRSFVADSIRSAAELRQQQRRYRELRLYHQRPKLRLPGTRMTRSRRRKSGLNTFLRNSLKRPRTLLGQQSLLFPPVRALSSGTKTQLTGYTPRANALLAYEHRDEALPIF